MLKLSQQRYYGSKPRPSFDGEAQFDPAIERSIGWWHAIAGFLNSSFDEEPLVEPISLQTTLDTWDEPITGMQFIRIPGGTFMMGAPEGEVGRCEDETLHEVTVSPFWIGQFQVTNRQYSLFDKEHVSGRGGFYSFDVRTGQLVVVDRHESPDVVRKRFGHPQKPAMSISWNSAHEFANWITRHSPTGRQFELPTEAQWEYACRGGTTTARFWGDSAASARHFANVYDLSKREQFRLNWDCHPFESNEYGTTPVGSLQANQFGLYDMLGNVWEWCRDIYDPKAYAKHDSHDPLYLGSGKRRVRRGGGWLSCPMAIRSSARRGFSPEFSAYPVGLRLVMKDG